MRIVAARPAAAVPGVRVAAERLVRTMCVSPEVTMSDDLEFEAFAFRPLLSGGLSVQRFALHLGWLRVQYLRSLGCRTDRRGREIGMLLAKGASQAAAVLVR